MYCPAMPDTLTASVTDVIELTRALVRCESVTPREAGALQHLEQTLAPLGFRCERMDFSQTGTDDVANLYARIGQDRNGVRPHFRSSGHPYPCLVRDLSSRRNGPLPPDALEVYLLSPRGSPATAATA